MSAAPKSGCLGSREFTGFRVATSQERPIASGSHDGFLPLAWGRSSTNNGYICLVQTNSSVHNSLERPKPESNR